jgi:hypothetical protein
MAWAGDAAIENEEARMNDGRISIEDGVDSKLIDPAFQSISVSRSPNFTLSVGHGRWTGEKLSDGQGSGSTVACPSETETVGRAS